MGGSKKWRDKILDWEEREKVQFGHHLPLTMTKSSCSCPSSGVGKKSVRHETGLFFSLPYFFLPLIFLHRKREREGGRKNDETGSSLTTYCTIFIENESEWEKRESRFELFEQVSSHSLPFRCSDFQSVFERSFTPKREREIKEKEQRMRKKERNFGMNLTHFPLQEVRFLLLSLHSEIVPFPSTFSPPPLFFPLSFFPSVHQYNTKIRVLLVVVSKEKNRK